MCGCGFDDIIWRCLVFLGWYFRWVSCIIKMKMTTEIKSILRYPGGKQRAVRILAEYIPHNQSQICSPFLGGGSFELYCASILGANVSGYDNFTPLVEFWQTLLSRPKKLADKVDEFLPILNRDDFYQLQKKQSQISGKLNRAAAFYVINRASFITRWQMAVVI